MSVHVSEIISIFKLWEFLLYADDLALVSGVAGGGSKSCVRNQVVTWGAVPAVYLIGFRVGDFPVERLLKSVRPYA
jgi:hypothetical protein